MNRKEDGALSQDTVGDGGDEKERVEDRGEFRAKVNWFALASFIVGIASFMLSYYFCISSAITLVLAVIGIKREKKCARFNNLAVSASVLGIISFIIWAVVWIFLGKYLIYAIFPH